MQITAHAKFKNSTKITKNLYYFSQRLAKFLEKYEKVRQRLAMHEKAKMELHAE